MSPTYIYSQSVGIFGEQKKGHRIGTGATISTKLEPAQNDTILQDCTPEITWIVMKGKLNSPAAFVISPMSLPHISWDANKTQIVHFLQEIKLGRKSYGLDKLKVLQKFTLITKTKLMRRLLGSFTFTMKLIAYT